jgi:5-formyltetrahydrofolate cyclo-ligase
VEQVEQYSQAICEKIMESPIWQNARTTALFAGLATEPQLRTVAEQALLAGGTILFPKIDPAQATLTFYRISHWKDLCPGAWGILEPGSKAPALASEMIIDLVCVPGLGFDRRGARLGRGKGYYDRFLASLPPATIKLGTFFAMQELAEVPEMSHDVRLDGIVTEQELFLL